MKDRSLIDWVVLRVLLLDHSSHIQRNILAWRLTNHAHILNQLPR